MHKKNIIFLSLTQYYEYVVAYITLKKLFITCFKNDFESIFTRKLLLVKTIVFYEFGIV